MKQKNKKSLIRFSVSQTCEHNISDCSLHFVTCIVLTSCSVHAWQNGSEDINPEVTGARTRAALG